MLARLAPVRAFVMSVLTPLFFATAGLRVDLTALRHPVVLGFALLVLLLAVLGKFRGPSSERASAGSPKGRRSPSASA